MSGESFNTQCLCGQPITSRDTEPLPGGVGYVAQFGPCVHCGAVFSAEWHGGIGAAA
jgi:hypothetical protein